MLFHNIGRTIVPTVHKFYTSATATHSVKLVKFTNFANSSSKLNSIPTAAPLSCLPIVKPRFYSQEVTTGTLSVVDFDHVKRATSMNEVMIVDVREPDEIKEHGKIPNSINIPLGSINTALSMSAKEFQEAFKRAKPVENTELIFYCMIGKRSGKAQQSALNLGFKNAKNYLGSWTDWSLKNQ